MGESLNAALTTIKNVVDINVITAKVGELVNMLPAPILALYQEHTTICLLAVVCLLALLAFEGYKLFKMALYVCSSIAFGVVGLWYIAPIIPDSVKAIIPEVVDFKVLVAVACALVALLICRCAYTLMIMILGGVVGYFVGSTVIYNLLISYFNTLEFLRTEEVKYIVGGAIASVVALLFIVLFKHMFIIVTALGGTVCAAFVLQSILIPAATDDMKICFFILAISVGVFGLLRQYKEEEKALEIVF